MPLRHIVCPPPIQVTDPASGKPMVDDQGQPVKPITLADLVTTKLLFAPIWAESYKAVKSAKAIDDAFAKGNGVVALAQEDWQRLKDLIENPKGGFAMHPAALRQLIPHFDAILNATETPPEA